MEAQPEYRRGFIYELRCNITDEVYIGGTFDLAASVSKHRSSSIYCISKQITSRGDYKFNILFDCYVPDKTELKKIEQKFIDTSTCINKTPVYRSAEDKKKRAHINCKNYYNINAEKIKAVRKEKFECECGGRYTRGSKVHHFKTKLHREYVQDTEPINP